MRRDLGTDLLWGVGHGVFAAALFSGLALIVYAVDEPPDQELRFGSVVMLYLAAGVLGGVVLGLLRPLYHSTAGAALAGFIIALLVYGGGLLATQPQLSLRFTFWSAVALGCLVGIPAGIYHHRSSQ